MCSFIFLDSDKNYLQVWLWQPRLNTVAYQFNNICVNNLSFYISARRNNQVLESEFRQSVVSRVSLSSIQQRVIRRLRDRPPKYETRHNYEYQQRQTERQISQQSSSVEPDRQSNPAPVGGPPPAYDGDTVQYYI